MLRRSADPASHELPTAGPIAATHTYTEITVVVLIGALMGAVFIFDIYTPPDDVSICFVYALLLSASISSYRGAAYWLAGLATFLSGLGAFIQTPPEALSLVFFSNRAIAVAAQWLVAFLVTMRKDSESLIRAEYEAERRKVETSRRFVDMLSHEIGTSLTVIGGQAFRLRKPGQGEGSDSVVERAEKIEQAVRHIEAVVRQVQVASEVEQDRMVFVPVAVDLAQILTDAVVQADTKRMIKVEVSKLPAVVWGDPSMLQQVFANLLSNATKYSAVNSPVEVRGRSEGKFAVVSVTDHGIGIPAEEQAKLFEPYYRAKNSRSVPGAGIGLYVVKRFVTSHEGDVEVTSSLGSGTTMTVRIPIGQKPAG